MLRREPDYNQGRPTIFKTEYSEQVIDLSKKGYTIAMICSDWGISERTFYYWKNKHESFRECFEIGRTAHKGYMERLLIDNLTNKNFNSIGWSMMMRCMHNYSETRVIHIEGIEKYETMTEKAKAIMNNVSAGIITPQEGDTLINSLSKVSKINLETDIEEKISLLQNILTSIEEDK